MTMNPLAHALLHSRRSALQTRGCGFGYLALAGLAAQEQARAALAAQSARAEGPALPGARQADHLPLHARRREPRGFLRLQAAAG